jgi:mRNA interferase RelE/StbE
MFEVRIKGKALNYLKALDEKKKSRIREIRLILEKDPVPFKACDVSKLKGYDNVYRIRVGDLRIVYEVFWLEKAILIDYIGPRGKAYK